MDSLELYKLCKQTVKLKYRNVQTLAILVVLNALGLTIHRIHVCRHTQFVDYSSSLVQSPDQAPS